MTFTAVRHAAEKLKRKGPFSGLHYRLAFRYAIEGDLRFISHHDTVRLFERAFARAELPAKRSAGFNPRPRLSLPLPRSVGIASRAELLIVELDGPLDAAEAMRRMAAQMPGGLQILDAFALANDATHVPLSVTYVMRLADSEVADVAVRAAAFAAEARIDVERRDIKSGRTRPVNVREFVREIGVADGRLVWTQSTGAGGTAKPGEVLQALGFESRGDLHRLERTRVEYAHLKRHPEETVTGKATL